MFDSETEAFCSLPTGLADEDGRRLVTLSAFPARRTGSPDLTADKPRALDQAWTSRPGMLAAAAVPSHRRASRCSRSLVEVEQLHVVEQPILLGGGKRAGSPALGVGPDERDRTRLDLHLAGADVAREELRHRLRLELLAERALEIDVLDHRHRRVRRSEHVAVLRNALEESVASGARNAVGATRAPQSSPTTTSRR